MHSGEGFLGPVHNAATQYWRNKKRSLLRLDPPIVLR
jgi:hypothetical protein